MPRVLFVEQLAKLLDLPAGIIRSSVGRMRFKVAAKRVGGPARPSKQYEENELYARWLKVPDEDKTVLEKKLFEAVRKHASAVVWTKLRENNPELASNVALAVIERLGQFRQRAKFGTWVHKIALNMVNMELRKRSTSRGRYAEYDDSNPGQAETFSGPFSAATIDRVEQRLILERVKREVSGKDYIVLECKLDDMSTAEIAERLGMTEDAAESHWRRLKLRLRKIFGTPRRKMPTSSN
jgi:RNA polymerase sigma factor (sigma-70 family)